MVGGAVDYVGFTRAELDTNKAGKAKRASDGGCKIRSIENEWEQISAERDCRARLGAH